MFLIVKFISSQSPLSCFLQFPFAWTSFPRDENERMPEKYVQTTWEKDCKTSHSGKKMNSLLEHGIEWQKLTLVKIEDAQGSWQRSVWSLAVDRVDTSLFHRLLKMTIYAHWCDFLLKRVNHCFTSHNLHARFDNRTTQRETFFSSYSSTFILYRNEWYRSIWKWICRNIHPKDTRDWNLAFGDAQEAGLGCWTQRCDWRSILSWRFSSVTMTVVPCARSWFQSSLFCGSGHSAGDRVSIHYFKRWRYLFCSPNPASIVVFWHFEFYSVWPGQCWLLTLREEDVAEDLPDLQLAKNTGGFLASPRVFLDAASSERNWLIHSNS